MPPHMGHGVDGAGAADDLAARPVMDAMRGMRLRHRAIGPVNLAPLQQRPFARFMDERVARGPASFDEADFDSWISAEAGCQNRAGGPRTNDQKVEPICRSGGHVTPDQCIV